MSVNISETCLNQAWIDIPSSSDFSVYNIPFGVFTSTFNTTPHIGTRLGDYILDLNGIQQLGLFKNSIYLNNGKCFLSSKLNQFMNLNRNAWIEARKIIQNIICNIKYKDIIIENNYLINVNYIKMKMPCNIGDYTDFYSSKNHATNVGIMFRGPKNALQPNWKHLPVGYHGRASSIILSGEDIVRPYGQLIYDVKEGPVFDKCKRLDIELEVGWFFGGKSNKLGERISIDNSIDNIFGMVLLNDWSARDIQKWEYIPLGPFNAKNFASSISPWIVTMEALKPFHYPMPKQSLLSYLNSNKNHLFDIPLTVSIQSPTMKNEQIISKSNTNGLYYSCYQQLTHHTSTGCNFKSGDFIGSGTISGTTKDSFGSLLELTWNGKNPIKLNDGTERTFLNDGDTIILRGSNIMKNGKKIGFGECRTTIKPAIEFVKAKL